MFKEREEEMGVIVGGIVSGKGLQFDTKCKPLNFTFKLYLKRVSVVKFFNLIHR
jgi:hypothetical protein